MEQYTSEIVTALISNGVRNLTNEQSVGVIVDWMAIGTAK